MLYCGQYNKKAKKHDLPIKAKKALAGKPCWQAKVAILPVIHLYKLSYRLWEKIDEQEQWSEKRQPELLPDEKRGDE